MVEVIGRGVPGGGVTKAEVSGLGSLPGHMGHPHNSLYKAFISLTLNTASQFQSS